MNKDLFSHLPRLNQKPILLDCCECKLRPVLLSDKTSGNSNHHFYCISCKYKSAVQASVYAATNQWNDEQETRLVFSNLIPVETVCKMCKHKNFGQMHSKDLKSPLILFCNRCTSNTEHFFFTLKD